MVNPPSQNSIDVRAIFCAFIIRWIVFKTTERFFMRTYLVSPKRPKESSLCCFVLCRNAYHSAARRRTVRRAHRGGTCGHRVKSEERREEREETKGPPRQG